MNVPSDESAEIPAAAEISRDAVEAAGDILLLAFFIRDDYLRDDAAERKDGHMISAGVGELIGVYRFTGRHDPEV